jgi:hypothetical protein
MQIPILIEPVADNGYRAHGGAPFNDVAEGATPEAALEKLRQSVERRLVAGARIVSLEVSPSDHVWLPFAGVFDESDPIVQKWLAVMKSRRDER